MLADQPMDLFQLCETPEEVLTAIFDFYEQRGFAPSAEEEEILLEL
ncbi:MAG: hypothetical protein ACPG5H_02580 [Cycloclasticus pugetii]